MANSNATILRQLLPRIFTGPNIDKIIGIQGDALDDIETVAAELLKEMFPDTTRDNISSQNPTPGASPYGLLEYWEAKYRISPSAGATLDQRRAVVIAHEAAIGGLSIPYFEGIVVKLGYTIGGPEMGDPHARLTDGEYKPFRADISQADIDEVYDEDTGASRYTCCVYGTNVETDTVLQTILNRLKKTGREILFINE
ncbi:MAG: DUF2313 domain-containing protein [Chitinispirillaceae bacterium]|nr:DUF2313 domain-containing protein [Chitinispirillaceae bacterium]